MMMTSKSSNHRPQSATSIHDPKVEKICSQFADNVSITGIRELQSEPAWNIKLLFATGLLSAISYAFYLSYHLAIAFLGNNQVVFNAQFKSDGEIFLPNLTICSLSQMNFTAARELVVISPEIQEAIDKLGTDREKFINGTAIWMTGATTMKRNMNHTLKRYILQALDESMEALENGMTDIIHKTTPSCQNMISECTLNDQPFDCCTHAVFNVWEQMVCYELPMQKYRSELAPSQNGPNGHRYLSKFDVNAQFDWRHIPFMDDDDPTDGFFMTINEPITGTATHPVAIATGWHATITLSRPRENRFISNCNELRNTPLPHKSPYYDNGGKYCQLEKLLDMQEYLLGCETPAMTYFPNKSMSCKATHLFSMLTGLNSAFDKGSIELPDLQVLKTQNLKALEDLIAKILEAKAVGKCKPLCQQWDYTAIVGYAQLSPNHTIDSQISSSRITVIIANEFYEIFTEEEPVPFYMLVSNIGGCFGTCAGFSIITFAQIIWYGYYSCVRWRKKKKTGPVVEGRRMTLAKLLMRRRRNTVGPMVSKIDRSEIDQDDQQPGISAATCYIDMDTGEKTTILRNGRHGSRIPVLQVPRRSSIQIITGSNRIVVGNQCKKRRKSCIPILQVSRRSSVHTVTGENRIIVENGCKKRRKSCIPVMQVPRLDRSNRRQTLTLNRQVNIDISAHLQVARNSRRKIRTES